MNETPELTWSAVASHFAPDVPLRLGVAVSGGSDSLGLLVLLAEWQNSGGPALRVVTVDHGLRSEAAGEAVRVASLSRSFGLAHDTLEWRGWDGHGNLPDAARRARYALMSQWAREHEISGIAIGHTLDDQAETFLMRLARGAGVDGLSAMRSRWDEGGVTFHRPLLGVSREALRTALRARAIDWIEDPTNTELAYERARARELLKSLAATGLCAQRIGKVAANLSAARETLHHYVLEAAHGLVSFETGDLVIARAGFSALPHEITRRLFQGALRFVSGSYYAPRGHAMQMALEAVRAGHKTTLHGCLLSVTHEKMRISREYRAVECHRVPLSGVWDKRWRIVGPQVEGAEIGALGAAGLRACPDWRSGGLPYDSAKASPGLWCGPNLISAPLAGWPNEWRAELIRSEQEFHAALLPR